MSWRSRIAVVLAGVAIFSIVALLGLQTWASMARGTLPRFSLLHAAPDGRVFVLLEDQLYVESPTGESLEVIPLGRFGVRAFEGDFAVLSDDSILLRTERLQPGQDPPLQRCALKTGECQRLTVAGETFRAGSSFKLAVEERAQRIRVADTDHHRLLLLDLDGRILRRREEGLRFPSSMARIAEGEFLVSDSLHALVVRVSGREDDTFGKELARFTVADWSKQPEHTRPKGVAITRDGTRWIVVTDDELSHGEFYRQGPGKPVTTTPIPLPEGTDTMFPEALGESVLLPDGGLYRIHRFAQDGTRLPDFGSPVLKARLAALAARVELLDHLSKGSYAGLLLGSVPLLMIALWLHRSAMDAREAEEEWEPSPDEAEGENENEAPSPDEDEAPPPDPEKDTAPPAAKDTAKDSAKDSARHRIPESRVRQLRGESLFQRRWLVLSSRTTRWMGWLGVMPVLVLYVLLFIWGVIRVTSKHAAGWIWIPIAGGVGLLTVTLLLLAAVVFQCRKHERLTLDGQGLRYASPFSGSLASFEHLSPSWAMEWRRVRRAELKRGSGGRFGGAWYYELEDHRGRQRRINALAWRLEGEEETGLTLWEVLLFRAAAVQAVIRKTRLHHHLSEYLTVLR